MLNHFCLSDSLQPYDLQPARLLCPWDSPGKNTGVGYCAFLQGDLPNPGIKPTSLISTCIGRQFFTTKDTWEAHKITTKPPFFPSVSGITDN